MRRLGGFRGAPEQDDGCREGSRGACWRRDTIHVLGARKATLMNAQETRSSDPALVHLPSLLPELEALYTDVHAHPELSMQETRTAGLAAERLRAAGYNVTTAASAAASSRETMVCRRMTVAAAITTGSMLAAASIHARRARTVGSAGCRPRR